MYFGKEVKYLRGPDRRPDIRVFEYLTRGLDKVSGLRNTITTALTIGAI